MLNISVNIKKEILSLGATIGGATEVTDAKTGTTEQEYSLYCANMEAEYTAAYNLKEEKSAVVKDINAAITEIKEALNDSNDLLTQFNSKVMEEVSNVGTIGGMTILGDLGENFIEELKNDIDTYHDDLLLIATELTSMITTALQEETDAATALTIAQSKRC